jgi:hypothetical protein
MRLPPKKRKDLLLPLITSRNETLNRLLDEKGKTLSKQGYTTNSKVHGFVFITFVLL